MSEIKQATTQQMEQHGPPMPRFMVKLMNPLMMLLLNSPMHHRMSNRLMVLTFKGRKSGKSYSTPVGYVRQGEDIYVFTHSAWRNNFLQPAEVKMRIQGNDVDGLAHLVSDPERKKQMIKTMMSTYGEEMSRRMGFWVDDLELANADEVNRATRGTYFIEIKVEGGG